MTSAQLNAFIYKLSGILMGLTTLWVISTLNMKAAIFIAFFAIVQNVAKILYVLEQGREDKVLIAKIQELVEKDRKEKNDV